MAHYTLKKLLVFAAAAVASPAMAADLASVSLPAPTETPVAVEQSAIAPPVAKAARHLRAGTVLHASDLVFEGGTPAGVDALKQLVTGKEIQRTVYAGVALPLAELATPTVIKRNAIVKIEFVRGPLIITTDGRALDPGSVGDTVRVMNLNSRITFSAVVTGANKVMTQ